MSNSKEILVTGGLGYIGSHTCVQLIEDGFNIVIIDNLSNSNILILDQIEKITGTKPSYYNINLLNKEEVSKVFDNHSIEKVIHFAAFKSVNESIDNALHYYNNNIISLLNLLSVMKYNDTKHLVFSSSCTVYGEANEMPVTEQEPVKKASSVYGTTKIMCEQILTDHMIEDKSFHATLLRYFNPVGAHNSGLIGELPNGTPANLFPYITQTYQGKREFLSIYGKDYTTADGTAIRDYIHVVDLAIGHTQALKNSERLNKENEPFICNLGTGKGYSVLEVVMMFEKVSQTTIDYKYMPRRQGDIEKIWADTSFAKKELGWEASLTLEDMVSSALKWESYLKERNYFN